MGKFLLNVKPAKDLHLVFDGEISQCGAWKVCAPWSWHIPYLIPTPAPNPSSPSNVCEEQSYQRTELFSGIGWAHSAFWRPQGAVTSTVTSTLCRLFSFTSSPVHASGAAQHLQADFVTRAQLWAVFAQEMWAARKKSFSEGSLKNA